MCRIKRTNTNFELFVEGRLIKQFKNERALNIYIKEFEIKDYRVKEGVSNARNKRLCS